MALEVVDPTKVETGATVDVALEVVDPTKVETGFDVSRLPPHPEMTAKTVTAPANFLTTPVFHHSADGCEAENEAHSFTTPTVRRVQIALCGVDEK